MAAVENMTLVFFVTDDYLFGIMYCNTLRELCIEIVGFDFQPAFFSPHILENSKKQLQASRLKALTFLELLGLFSHITNTLNVIKINYTYWPEHLSC